MNETCAKKCGNIPVSGIEATEFRLMRKAGSIRGKCFAILKE
jgi:hypothetical protein